jgi:phosphatidylinositol glycan class B
MRFLTCEPNLSNLNNYTEEADVFYNDPAQWLESEYHENVTIPSHLVLYDVLAPKINGFIRKHDYHECARFFHAHLRLERRIGNHVVVQCR